MKNARWFRIVCATLTYIYTIAVCSSSEVVEELVCMGRWRPPGALHVHLGSVAALRAARRRHSSLGVLSYCNHAVAECMHSHYIAEAGHNLLASNHISDILT